MFFALSLLMQYFLQMLIIHNITLVLLRASTVQYSYSTAMAQLQHRYRHISGQLVSSLPREVVEREPCTSHYNV